MTAAVDLWEGFFLEVVKGRSAHLRYAHTTAKAALKHAPRKDLYDFVSRRQVQVLLDRIEEYVRGSGRGLDPLPDPRVQNQIYQVFGDVRHTAEYFRADVASVLDRLETTPDKMERAHRVGTLYDQEKYNYDVLIVPQQSIYRASWFSLLPPRFHLYVEDILELFYIFPYEAFFAYVRRNYPGAIGAFHGLDGD
jgi:hypothetical protein